MVATKARLAIHTFQGRGLPLGAFQHGFPRRYAFQIFVRCTRLMVYASPTKQHIDTFQPRHRQASEHLVMKVLWTFDKGKRCVLRLMPDLCMRRYHSVQSHKLSSIWCRRQVFGQCLHWLWWKRRKWAIKIGCGKHQASVGTDSKVNIL